MKRILRTSEVREIVDKTFPGYVGKEVIISDQVPEEIRSYWDEGSKTEYIFLHLISGESFSVQSNHPYFERENPSHLGGKLPENVVLVAHDIGRFKGLTIYGDSSVFVPMLNSETVELTDVEKNVLKLAVGMKSSYGGISNYRRHYAIKEGMMSGEEYDQAILSLQEKKLLAKNKSATTEGKNVVVEMRGW